MPTTLIMISSMATRSVLAELIAAHERASGVATRLEAVGGVDAAQRVQRGEPFDVVVLASGAMDTLAQQGHTRPGSQVGLVRSGVAVAVRAGAPRPDISDEAALRAAVLAAPSIGTSTGPSGTYLLKTFERWGILEAIGPRMVQATPGVPVATMVAEGRVALGFQQLSELLHVPGIDIVGPLPAGVQLMTTFSAAVARTSVQPKVAADLIAFMASPAATEAKRRQGMEPA
jgi:molybdate transport system substrate-binding protein